VNRVEVNERRLRARRGSRTRALAIDVTADPDAGEPLVLPQRVSGPYLGALLGAGRPVVVKYSENFSEEAEC
jgi:hypothetical protein